MQYDGRRRQAFHPPRSQKWYWFKCSDYGIPPMASASEYHSLIEFLESRVTGRYWLDNYSFAFSDEADAIMFKLSYTIPEFTLRR